MGKNAISETRHLLDESKRTLDDSMSSKMKGLDVASPPAITLIWINWNGLKIIDIVKESLKAIRNLNYPDCELIIVDNGSTDGSFKVIRKYIEDFGMEAKLLMLEHNQGFAGGCNAAFRLRNCDSKYVVLLSSDLIPLTNSLLKLVEAMESDATLGAVQGVLLEYDGEGLDNSGGYLDEFLSAFSKLIPIQTTERYVTYADGAYCIVRVDAIKCIQDKCLFDEELFAYGEDVLLGVKLWNNGYKVLAVPHVVGRHKRGSSSEYPLKTYQGYRNWVVLHQLIFTRLKSFFYILLFRDFLLYALRRNLCLCIKAVVSGFKIGRVLRMKGRRLDLYRAPHIRLREPMKSLVTPWAQITSRISIDDVNCPQSLRQIIR